MWKKWGWMDRERNNFKGTNSWQSARLAWLLFFLPTTDFRGSTSRSSVSQQRDLNFYVRSNQLRFSREKERERKREGEREREKERGRKRGEERERDKERRRKREREKEGEGEGGRGRGIFRKAKNACGLLISVSYLLGVLRPINRQGLYIRADMKWKAHDTVNKVMNQFILQWFNQEAFNGQNEKQCSFS